MARIFASLCVKHPEFNGERYSHNRCCVKCVSESNIKRAKERYHQDPEYRSKVIAAAVEYGKSDVDGRRCRANRSYSKNKSSYRARRLSYGRVRRHGLTRAQLPWVDASKLSAVYAEAQKLGMSVDHIVPLVHPLVCGLHVPWNLRIIPLRENLSKGNKFDVS